MFASKGERAESLRRMLNARSAELIGDDRQKLGISLHNISQPRCISDVHIRHLSTCRAKTRSKRREARRETRDQHFSLDASCLNLYALQLPTRRTRHSPLRRAEQNRNTAQMQRRNCDWQHRIPQHLRRSNLLPAALHTKRECVAAQEGKKKKKETKKRKSERATLRPDR